MKHLFLLFALLSSLSIAQQYTPDAHTVALWHFNETSGSTVADTSGNGINGTATGTTIVNGRFGKARSFNGSSSDYISTPANSAYNIAGPFTIEAWLNKNGNLPSGAIQEIVTRRLPNNNDSTNYEIYVENQSGVKSVTVRYTFGGASHDRVARAAIDVTDGRWHHIAGIFTGTSLNLYVDGALSAQTATSNIPDNYTGGVNIGREPQPTYYLFGIVDEVRISNIARSPNEFDLQLPPTNLHATHESSTIINLSWQNGGGAVGLLRYKIYRGADSTNVSLIDSTTQLLYTNSSLSKNTKYFYRVSAVDSTGFEGAKSFVDTISTSVDQLVTGLPGEYKLEQNYPNPFNPTTSIHYEIPARSQVKLEIYNTLGQIVALLVNGVQEAGYYDVPWQVPQHGISSGLYFYRLEAIDVSNPARSFVQVRKMVLMK